MAEHVISPDGKYMLVNGEWILLPNQQVNVSDSVITGDVNLQSTIHFGATSNKEENIRNLAELCIDKLENGDMKSSVEAYTEAKKLDVELAKSLFQGEYSTRIGSAYADIVESYLVQILNNPITHSSRNFGMGVVSHDVDGHHKAFSLADMMEIAFDNTLAFLGTPDDIVDGGDGAFDFPFTDVIDELMNIDTNSPTFSQIRNLKFNKQPNEESVKQKYRIGLAFETAMLNIFTDVTSVVRKLPHDDINRSFIDSTKYANLADYATNYTIKVVAIAVHEGYDIESWKREFSPKITALIAEKMRSKKMDEEGKILMEKLQKELDALLNAPPQTQSSDCFIATAAYGTMHESKIDVLRCLRDTKMIPSGILEPFVRFYYRNSPPIARYISTKPMLKTMVRISLNPVIAVVRFIVRKEFPTWTDSGNPV
jgi:hypothetical protein